VVWFFGLFLWAFLGACILSFDPADPPSHAVSPHNTGGSISNWLGPAGAWVAYQTVLMIGSGVWVIVVSAGAYLALIAFRGTVTHMAVRAVGIVMVALAFSGFHALLAPSLSSFPEGGGGLVAIAGVRELAERFGGLGAALWITLLGVVGLTVAFDDWFAAAARALSRPLVLLATTGAFLVRVLARLGGLLKRLIAPAPAPVVARAPKAAPATPRIVVRPAAAVALTPASSAIEDSDDAEADETDEAETEQSARTVPTRAATVVDREEDVDESDETEETVAEDEADSDESEVAAEAGPKSFDPETLREKISKLPVRFATAAPRMATQEDLDSLRAGVDAGLAAERPYLFPSVDLLVDPEASYSRELESYVREQAEALESALQTYNIKGEVVGIDSGPVITLYQVRLAPGTKVSSITAVASDVARSLKSANIRVVPNTEGLDTVGVEVPNRKKEKVRLKELMTSSDATRKMRLPLFLGKDASGAPLIVDLAAMPHMLIAGTTGSGKSVCINAIIMGFLYTQKPSDLKLVLVDPKMVELSQFKDIPHLMCPVVTEMGKAAAILEWAVTKMDERYELLAEAGCRDVAAYNELPWEELKQRFNPQSEVEEARIPRKLPFLVFIIDELADLIITHKEVEGEIVRIAQKARAVGIHLHLATQRPQANVVTGLIKSNMPARVAFKVASGMDSRIVLDMKGGELLLGQGDMLMVTPRSSTPIRAQGTLVDDNEIRKVVRFVRESSAPTYERQLLAIRSSGYAEAEPGSVEHEQRMLENAQEDPLFDRAVEIVLETKRGSVSLLQRRLAIGYTRASRLIELMGMAGIIGDHKGSVAREVVISLEEWEAMKKQAAADAAEAEAAGKPAPPRPRVAQPKLFTDPDVPSGPPSPDVLTTEGTEDTERAVGVESESSQTAPMMTGDVGSDEEEEDLIPTAQETPVIAVADSVEEQVAADPAGAAVEDEAEAGDSDEDDDEYEYEYEYVELDEGEALGEEYEVVDEEDEGKGESGDEAPEVKTFPLNEKRAPARTRESDSTAA